MIKTILNVLVLFLVVAVSDVHAVRIIVSDVPMSVQEVTETIMVKDVHAAQAKAREYIAKGLTEDLEVIVYTKRVELSQPLVFRVKDGGGKHKVIWRAGNKGVEINGGRVIKGFTATKDGVWKTTLADVKNGKWAFRELFVNGKRQIRARYPNDDFLRVVKAYPDNRTGFTFNQGEITQAVHGDDIELVFFHDWSSTRVRVKALDYEKRTLTVADPIGPAANHYRITHFEQHPRYYLENAKSLLDVPGEWYLDKKSGELFYKPRAGEKIEDMVIEAPYADALVVVKGEDGAAVRNLHFEGFTFRLCRWDIPKHGYAGSQACYHEERDAWVNKDGRDGSILRHFVPAGVRLEIAEDCSIKHCRFGSMGGVGVEIGQRCHRNVFEGNVIRDVSGNGIMIGEGRTRRWEGKRWSDVAEDQTATGNVVRNNLIEDVGKQFFGAVGIWAGITRETRIVHNLVRNTPYTGVSIGWVWSPEKTPARDNVLAFNHIHHVMQMLSDGGGIYTLGRQPGTILRGNHVHDVPVNLGRAESNGFFMDEGTTDMLVEGNVFYRIAKSPLRFHRATVNVVRNNYLGCKPGTPGFRYNATKAEDIKKENNVAYEGETPLPASKGLMDKAGLEEKYRHLLK